VKLDIYGVFSLSAGSKDAFIVVLTWAVDIYLKIAYIKIMVTGSYWMRKWW